MTPLGEEIVRQAQSVIEQAAAIKEIAKRGKDPLSGPLRLGVIYTIGPYLLPALVRQAIEQVPQMPLMLQENFTAKLLEMLRTGELDCAIMAEPFPDTGLAVAPLYDEPFMVALPAGAPAGQAQVDPGRGAEGGDDAAARHRPLLSRPRARGLPRVRALLEQRRGHPQELRGLVAGDDQAHGRLGHGHHRRAAAVGAATSRSRMLRYVPFAEPVPTRRVVLAWRRSFTRYEAIAALAQRRLCLRAEGRDAAVLSGRSPARRAARIDRPALQ